MDEKLKNLKLDDKADINILLLGETGVGKSTFINSLANYLQHHDLETAMKNSPLFLIPCMFTLTDEDYQFHNIVIGADTNECLQVGDSATQDVKTYVFPLGNGKTRLRFIDTPGMGDPRGVDQDDINCDNILSYIGQLDHLHAICFLFKPNEARITVTFEYCVKQILSRLEKSAAKNILFVFTNSKGTNYKPGETIACLKKIVENIKEQPPHVDIMVKDNVFCFDNEAFRYLMAAKKSSVKFSDASRREFIKSWGKSSDEAWKLIKFIIGDFNKPPLTPHAVKNSVSINEARRVIHQLGQPLADISQLIFDNLRLLDRREKELQYQNFSLDELKGKLYVPVISLRVIKLTQPTTVCCDDKCREPFVIDGQPTWNFKQRCHDPCYLKNVPQEMIGAPQLQSCAAMDRRTQTCVKCGCPAAIHMHIYYMTEKFDDKKVDSNVLKRINTTEKALAQAERVIVDIKQKKKELEEEKDTISRCAAHFARFLQTNAITPFNDAYRKYIEYMITREEAQGRNADQESIRHFRDLLRHYDEVKSSFEKLAELSAQLGKTSPQDEVKDVTSQLNVLYNLKHNGAKIKELYKSQKSARKNEYQKTEYIHSAVVKPRNSTDDDRKTQSDVEGAKPKKFNKQHLNNNQQSNQNKYNRFGKAAKDNSNPPPLMQRPLERPATNYQEPTQNTKYQWKKKFTNHGQNAGTVPKECIKIEITKNDGNSSHRPNQSGGQNRRRDNEPESHNRNYEYPQGPYPQPPYPQPYGHNLPYFPPPYHGNYGPPPPPGPHNAPYGPYGYHNGYQGYPGYPPPPQPYNMPYRHTAQPPPPYESRPRYGSRSDGELRTRSRNRGNRDNFNSNRRNVGPGGSSDSD